MTYFTLSASRDEKEIGFYPQTTLAKDYNPTLDDSHRKVFWSKFPNFNPVYNLELNANAIRTDYLDAIDITTGFVISPRFKAILETCHLPPHRFYPIKVEHKGMTLDYFWFHHIADIYRHIDLMASSVTIFHKFNFKIIENLKIESLEKVKKLKSSLPFDQGMRFNEIVLKRDFPDYDVFDLTDIQFVSLISERLLDKLQSAKLTGYQAKSYEIIKSSKS
jgi:hypothetical protein